MLGVIAAIEIVILIGRIIAGHGRSLVYPWKAGTGGKQGMCRRSRVGNGAITLSLDSGWIIGHKA